MMGNFYLINQKASWAAVCISRIACTSLKRQVLEDSGIILNQKDQIHDAIGYSDQSPYLRPIAEGKPSGLTTFAVWRDPISRFISTFRHFAIEKYPGRLRALSEDIDKWIDAAEMELEKPVLEQDEHLRRQSDYYQPSDVDAIVAIEDLDEWLISRGGGRLSYQNISRLDYSALTAVQEERLRRTYAADWALLQPTVTIPREPPLIQGLWVGGQLPPLAELTIRSFLDHGFPFRLAAYRSFDNLPEGAEFLDAREILEEELIYTHPSGSLSPFADWFRYRMLETIGGVWTDMDMACLRPFRLPSGPWCALANPETANIGLLQLPTGHPIAGLLGDLAEDPAAIMPWDGDAELSRKQELRLKAEDPRDRRLMVRWGDAGPWEFTKALKHFGLFSLSAPPHTTYPIPWGVWRQAYDGTVSPDDPQLERTIAIHLWGEMLRREPLDLNSLAPGSIVGCLMRRHLIRPSAENASDARNKSTKILVGICSCQHHVDRRKAVRRTWLSEKVDGIEAVFFIGESSPHLPEECDTIMLAAPDTYDQLPRKVLAFFEYAISSCDFDWLFKCDDDTYVALDRLGDLIPVDHDLVGNDFLESRGSPSGGAGYLLSRKLVEKLVNDQSIPDTGCEDVLIGEAALRLGARALATSRLCWDNARYPGTENDVVTSHWCPPTRLDLIHTVRRERPEVIHAIHPFWADQLLLYPSQFFKRASTGCLGKWESLSNREILLHWDDWPTERFVLTNQEAVHTGMRSFVLDNPDASTPEND